MEGPFPLPMGPGPGVQVGEWPPRSCDLHPRCARCHLSAALRCSALSRPSVSGASVVPVDSTRATRHTAQTAVKKVERPQAWTPGRSPKELHRP